jgi:hypothetical protein
VIHINIPLLVEDVMYKYMRITGATWKEGAFERLVRDCQSVTGKFTPGKLTKALKEGIQREAIMRG